MPNDVAIIFADSHLAPAAWTTRPAIAGDSYYSFEQIVDYAIKRNLPIIGAGDLLDVRKPDSATAAFLRMQCERLAKNEIEFYYTLGQHDLTNPSWFYAIHGSPIHLHEQKVSIGDEEVYGLDWTPSDQLNEKLAKAPRDCVLMVHQVWEQFMGGGSIVCDGSLIGVSDVSLIVTGDYHVHLHKSIVNAQGKHIEVYSPGSTCLQSIDEPPDKFFYVLDSDYGMRSVPLKTRPVFSSKLIHNEDTLDEFCDTIKMTFEKLAEEAQTDGVVSAISEPLIRVTYTQNVPNALARIRAAVPNVQHLFEKLITPQTEARQKRVVRHQQILKDGLQGAVDSITEDNPAIQASCRRLLNAESPELELQTMKDEFFS